MSKKIFYCLFFLNSITFYGYSQIGLQVEKNKNLTPIIKKNLPPLGASTTLPDLNSVFKMPSSKIKQPKAYHYEHLAFFCKVEVQLEQKTQFPVKFRLGDVQYVDELEGKN